MKKIVVKRIIITIVFMTIFSLCPNVKALYNGSAGTSFDANYTGSCTSKNCYSSSFDNANSMIVQARLYYINNASFEQIGETVYFVNSIANNSLPNDKIKVVYLSSLNSCTNYDCAKTQINNYFNNTVNATKILNEITGDEDYNQILIKEVGTNKGYRIMLEPAKVYLNPSFSSDKVALITAKGLASETLRNNDNSKSSCEYSYRGNCIPECTKGTCQNPLTGSNSLATSFIVDKKDVGIDAITKTACSNITVAQLSDNKIGCGYSLLDISKYTKKSCYSMSIDKKSLSCLKSDENNVATLEENVVETSSCTDTTINKYGKSYSNVGGTCKIYCKESATVSLPGNILNSQIKGSYFSWPTRPEDKNGIYPLTVKTSLTCHIVDTGGPSESISATSTRKCSTGYTEMSEDKNYCRSNNATKNATCPSGTTSDGDTKNTCTKILDVKDKICPSGSKADSSGVCRKISSYNCSKGTYDSTNKTCRKEKVNQFSTRCSDGKYDASGKYCYKYNRSVATYGCPSGEELIIDRCYRARRIDYHCSSGHTLVGTVCHYTGDLVPVYDYQTVSGSTCPDGYVKTGTGLNFVSCRKLLYNYHKCQSDAWLLGDRMTCEYHAYQDQLYCPDGYDTSSSSTGVSTRACSKLATPSTYGPCPSNWKNPGNTKSWCYKDPEIDSFCPSGFNKDLGNEYCGNTNYIGDPIYNGSKVDKICPTGYEEKNGKCYKYEKNISKICSTDETLINGKCYKVIEKSVLEYSCPDGYEKEGTSCKKICNSDTPNGLKETVKTELKKTVANSKIKLAGGTNKLFSNYLSKTSSDINEKVDKNNSKTITYSITTNFYIPENTNRYQNLITGAVTNTYSKGLYDRKEGVISTSINDSLNQKYELTISQIELGNDNKFGKKIEDDKRNTGSNYKYTCNYKLTASAGKDPNPCTCPGGTDNAGDKISDLINTCNNPEAKNYKYTCAELQHLLCDKTEPNNSPFICKRQYTCRGNKNVDITSCVENERKTGKSLEKAITTCTEQNNSCNGNYCYNEENERQDLTTCIESGNSRTTCMKKYGCSGNSCLGICTEATIISDSATLTYNRCNNNGKQTICSPTYSCKDNNKKVSSSAEECVSSKLQMSLTDALNKGVDSNKIVAAMNSCKESICIAKDSPLAIYRTIDLNNPFPGKEGKSSGIGFSNNNKSSRIPGSNWNGTTLVKNKILTSRGKSGNSIYSGEPLYRITLTPETIKKIKESNKNYKYGEIACDGNSLCISKFLHEELNVVAKAGCDDLVATSSLEEYKKCYNSNN